MCTVRKYLYCFNTMFNYKRASGAPQINPGFHSFLDYQFTFLGVTSPLATQCQLFAGPSAGGIG